MLELLIAPITSIIDKIIPDPAQRDKAKIELLALQQNGQLKEMEVAMSAIVAEANGQSALQRNWRPVTMLCFVGIIVNNYMIYPYLSLFWSAAPLLPVPQDLWELIKIGLGGYVIGRTVEKSVAAWKKP